VVEDAVAMDVIRMIRFGWSVVPSDRCWKRGLGYRGKCDIGDERGGGMAGDPLGDIPEMMMFFSLGASCRLITRSSSDRAACMCCTG